MKKLFLFVVVIFLASGIFAQSEKGYVYLKNGTILKGRYLFTGDSSKIQVQTGGNRWIFEKDEVERVTGKLERRTEDFQNKTLNSLLFVRSEIGVLAGSEQNSQTAPFTFSASLNYLVQPKLAVGAGFGLEFLKETYLPVFLNVEYKFRDAFSTPYVFLKTGYQLPLEESREVYYSIHPDGPWSSDIWLGGAKPYVRKNDTQGGFTINPGLGYQNMFSANFGMSFAFGYQFTRLNYKADDAYKMQLDYNRLSIKIGIIFN